eukprot:CAMPEP_0118673002 /NCGR_PEP_ID=MMETSP0800-20121206/78_1 /TAXON_ID=210618 ORGANISM="Striatella unipunctata, Strain CCMP2910" /NCGR_SAMPLE_ID=MMETSP0800 /ASSEMBLY_ACC=CAM_ASM_000638 /LENGTH=318 /DNA_ID=CAMNT_0006568013 /DNA_START=151 /DNA_END=1107 /DNA_ORIENTATION=-
MGIVFIFTVLELATTLDLYLPASELSICLQTRAGGGLVVYAMGTTFGLTGLVLMKWILLRSKGENEAFSFGAFAPRSPPLIAFQHKELGAPQANAEVELQEPLLHRPTTNEVDETETSPIVRSLEPTKLEQIVAFESGLLSCLLLIPTLVLPIMRFEYGGVGSVYFSKQNLEYYWWQIPQEFWANGRKSETPLWMVVVLTVILVWHAFILPIVGLIIAVMAQLTPLYEKSRRPLIVSLQHIYPMSNGFMFALAVIGTLYTVPSVAGVLARNRLCSELMDTIGNTCLTVDTQVLPGTWSYLFHSLFLEIFVYVTMRKLK